MSVIHSETKLSLAGSQVVLRLPVSASAKLPSRGMVMVEGDINDFRFQAPLEPDGRGSHWLKVGKSLREAIGARVGDTVKLDIEPSKEWPEPEVPTDLQVALAADPSAEEAWTDITPMARWDWIRWIGSTRQPETRKRRIEATRSKLKDAKRRPCCFNRTQCTDPTVSKNGVLLESSASSS